MKLKLGKFKKFILDLILPQFCVGCGQEGTLLCVSCNKKIVPVQSPTCPDCDRLSEKGRYCPKCRKNKALSGVIVSAYYEEGPLREMIHNFKYNHALELKKVLADLLCQAVMIKPDLLTFTPLHPRRLAERGFNQAELLAEALAKKLKIACKPFLIKTKSTKRQVGLTGSKRRGNLEGVFKVHKVKSLKGKKILIVDDITTTGTTLNECAKVLKAAGAKEVWGLVVAKG